MSELEVPRYPESYVQELRERAERAEATIREMAAEALSREAECEENYLRAERAEAAEANARRRLNEAMVALARVRSIEEGNVCPHGYEPGEPGCTCYMCRVRAAIEGTNP